MTTPNSIFTGLTGDILYAFESTCKPLITADHRSSKVDDGKSAAQAKTDFTCLICYFSSNWESGLQVDEDETLMDDDLEEDTKYPETSHYWRTGRLGCKKRCFWV